MDGRTGGTGAVTQWRSAMLDVSSLSLTDLAAGVGADLPQESPLAYCLRRLADDLARPGEPIAGFNSAL
ncbi:FXSXX-COOH protein [Actinoplanes sp. NPDC051859]|uniref:FXSXX-COOH protein n=1 Tax=Actinoplanes sp. NPDC051859 TaxID=3363909 RepID=UPI0037A6CA4E